MSSAVHDTSQKGDANKLKQILQMIKNDSLQSNNSDTNLINSDANLINSDPNSMNNLINSQDENGWTALGLASVKGHH